MKLPVKIILINVALAILFALLFGSTQGITDGYVFMFGLVALGGGAIDIIVGLLLLLATDKRYAQGFLLSGGVLLLLGFLACSTTGLI
jgi:hypothetical protein